MTAAQLSHIETGRSASPEFITVIRIAAALNASLDDIAAKTGAPGFGKLAREMPSPRSQIIQAVDELARIEASARAAADAAAALTRLLSSRLPTLARQRKTKR